MTQERKAEVFLSQHTTGKLLILPNIWNPIGARILESRGFPSVATASAAISASLGYDDGEKIKRSTLISILTRIASSVDVPVTADIESGFARRRRNRRRALVPYPSIRDRAPRNEPNDQSSPPI